MKRSSNQLDPSIQNSHVSPYAIDSQMLKTMLTYPKEYKSLVTTRTQRHLTHLSELADPEVFKRTRCLIQISKLILQLDARDHTHIMNILLNRLLVEEERNDLKVMVIVILQKVTPLPHINPIFLLDQFVSHLSCKSVKVRCQLYKAITNILKIRQVICDVSTENKIYDLFKRVLSELSEPHHRIRSECLGLLSVLSRVFINHHNLPGSKNKIMSEMEVQTVISKYVLDADPRVRRSALNSLVEMHLCGCSLDQPLYYLAVESLSDDFEEVRLRGLDLVWSLCSLYPDYRMPLANEHVKEKVRLIDDAFSRVCDLVNDVSVVVRTKACVMLASYHNVEADVLAQTFSKQIMSRLRRKIPSKKDHSFKKTTSKIQASGDFNVDSEEFRILDSGACGAFIHGLEDEYQEVRNASIDSICELCMYHGSLIKQAVLCLVDMFNDEIDKVRINAIQSLRKIGSKATLKFDSEELEVALGAFEDSDRVARQAAHDLMKVARLFNANDLEKLLLALMANVKRYPEDKLSILRCLCEVGKKHSDFIISLVPSLLHLDKRFLAREQPISDYTYTSSVILIINACTNDTTILSMLPNHIFAQLSYYKRKYPDCIPDLQELCKNTPISLNDGDNYLPTQLPSSMTDAIAVDVEEYIGITMTMLKTLRNQVQRLDLNAALLTISTAKRNFEYISTLDPIHAETSYLAILYLQCYEIVIEARKNLSTSSYASTAQKSATLLLQQSYKMQHSFLGLSTETLQVAMYFRLLANMIWLFGMLKQTPISTTSPTTIRNMLNAFVCRVDVIQKYFNPRQPHYAAIIDLRSNLIKASERPTTTNMSQLYSFIMDFLPLDIEFTSAVKRTWSIITSPIPDPDKPIKFDPIFPIELTIEANLTHTLDTSQIGIEFILPDQSSFFFWPKSSEFVPTYSDCHQLLASVTFNLPSWKESDVVICRIVVSFDPDLPGLDDYITKSTKNNKTSRGDLSPIQHFSTIVISDPLVIHLAPFSALV